MRDISGLSSRLGRAMGMSLDVRQETQGPFPVATGILGFLSIFKRSQASSPFEALNSVFLSNCQRDAIPPVEMRRVTRAFSKVSTGDSEIPSSCEMKMILHSSQCRVIGPYFKSGHLGVHSILGSKLNVPLTYL